MPYRGPLGDFVYQMVGGAAGGHGVLRDEGHRRACGGTRGSAASPAASMAESHPHDIMITKESPNYTPVEVGEG